MTVKMAVLVTENVQLNHTLTFYIFTSFCHNSYIQYLYTIPPISKFIYYILS